MKVKLDFASNNIKRGNLKNFLKIGIDVSDDKPKSAKKNTKPVFLIPVLDCSGSMSSYVNDAVCTINSNSMFSMRGISQGLSKLECAKDATIHLMDLLNDGDKFAVVSFDDKVYINQQPISINSKNKKEIQSNIRKIASGGCTNISGAIETAFDLFSKVDTSEYNCKIVLLSDGQANVGFDREEQFIPLMSKILSKGISTSTIGLGNDYDLGIMETISSNCAGSFNHIANALTIKDIFASELRTTQDIVCKDVVVKLALPDMVAFKPNFNSYSEDIRKNNICITLGNLYNNKDIYYEFSVLDENAEKVCISVLVEYETPKGAKTTAIMMKELLIVEDDEDAGENELVITEVLEAIKDRYIYGATKSTSACDYDSAKTYYTETQSCLNSIAASYSCCNSVSMQYSDEVEKFSDIISSASSDNLRTTFANTSKKMRNN